VRLRSVAGQESFHNAAAFLRSTFPFFKRLSLSTLIARYSPSVWLTGSASTACNPAPFEMKYWESTEATLFPTPPFPPQEEMNRCILRRTTKVCFARQRLSFHAQARLQSSSVANGNQDGFAPVVSDWRVDHGGHHYPPLVGCARWPARDFFRMAWRIYDSCLSLGELACKRCRRRYPNHRPKVVSRFD